MKNQVFKGFRIDYIITTIENSFWYKYITLWKKSNLFISNHSKDYTNLKNDRQSSFTALTTSFSY